MFDVVALRAKLWVMYHAHIIDTECFICRLVNLTISEGLLERAKFLNLNTTKSAEAGIEDAIKKIQTSKWLELDKEALLARFDVYEYKNKSVPFVLDVQTNLLSDFMTLFQIK